MGSAGSLHHISHTVLYMPHKRGFYLIALEDIVPFCLKDLFSVFFFKQTSEVADPQCHSEAIKSTKAFPCPPPAVLSTVVI